MPRKVRYARIAITLPKPDLVAADRLATRFDRSRSWIVAEAIRQYVASQAAAEASSALGASRSAQLRRDLTLTPEQRVREAEETLRLSERTSSVRPQAPQTFESYDAFLDWKRKRETGT
ncbi:MAG: hypothetical protein ACT4P7_15200 [Gemmatimonadaceae bacterium]